MLHSATWWRLGAPALLLLIFLAAAWLRVTHHNWDQDQQLVPDEHLVTQTTLDRVQLPPGTTLSTLLDPRRSPINPRPPGLIYHYGALPVYITKLATAAASTLTSNSYFTTYDGTEQAGRVLAGLFDSMTVLLVFGVGFRLWGIAPGLVAAALYAFAVLPIHLGHMYISDPFMTFFMTAALLCSVLYYQMRQPGWLLLAGLCVGLAMACKMSAATALALPLVAVFLPTTSSEAEESPSAIHRPSSIVRALRLTALALLGAFLGLLVGDPFAVLDAPTYLSQITDQVTIASGAVDPWFTRRYVGTQPVLYPWLQLALLGVGPLVGLAATLGAGVVAAWAWRKRGGAETLLLVGAGAYFASIAFTEAKWVRYLLPLVAYLCLFATALVVQLMGYVARGRVGTLARYALPAVLVMSAVAGAFAFRAIYGVETTRVQAAHWIYANIPAGDHIAVEVNDGLMPRPLPGHTDPEKEYNLVWLRMLADFPSAEASNTLRDQLAQADYLVFCPVRPQRTVIQMPWRYPVQNRYYELLLSGRLGFVPVYKATSYPSIFGIAIPDDGQWVDASFIEYDHPPITVLKKQRTLSNAEWDALFADAARQPSVATRHAP